MEFYLPLLSNLGSFQLYGLVTQMLRPILTRRGRIVDFLLYKEVWVSCLCSSLAAPWTSLWYPTSYREAAGVRAGRRQGMASANCTAISSELGVWGENITQGVLLLGNEGWWGMGVWPICQQQERILIISSAWSKKDRAQCVFLLYMG